MYEIVFLDIDDTILQSGKELVSAAVIDAINQAEARGVRVCLNTGRGVRRSMPIIEQLDAKGLVSTLDGLCVYDPVTHRSVYENKLTLTQTMQVINIAEEHGAYIEMHGKFEYFVCVNNQTHLDYHAGNMVEGLVYVDCYNGLRENAGCCFDIIIGGDNNRLDDISGEVRRRFERLELRKHLWDNFLFISAENTGKAHGMAVICNYYGISPDRAMAVGDYNNDIDMLKAAGLGVAMGNASDSAKAAANYITDTVENDGAAKAINKFILNAD